MPTPNSLDHDTIDVRSMVDEYYSHPIVQQLSADHALYLSLTNTTTYLLTHAIATAYANTEQP